MLNGLDLFSGIGGLTLALQPWVRPVAYCEINRYAQAVLLSRMRDGAIPTAPIWSDVSTLNIKNLEFICELYQEESDMVGKLKKITEEQANEAVMLYDQGMSLADLGHIYSVSRQSMWDLLSRRTKLRCNKRWGKDNHFYRGGKRSDRRAQKIFENELRYGRVVNPGICSVCGSAAKFKDERTAVQGHHDDYNKPLEIRWLCQQCHHEWHKNNKPIAITGGTSEEVIVDIVYGGFP